MSHKTQTFFWIGLALFISAGIGYYNIRNDIAPQNTEEDIKITDNDIDDTDNTDILSDDTPEDVVIVTDNNNDKSPVAGNEVAYPTITVPDLDRPIVFSVGYSAEKAEEVTGYITILADALKADSNRFNEWLDLGLLRKSIEDYEGAREAWEYASAIRPGNSLSFVNLGTLYGYYLHEPLKAEANLLHAIENEPRFLGFYTRMTDFYIEVMNDRDRAIDFLDRTIEKYPEWTDIKGLRKYIAE